MKSEYLQNKENDAHNGPHRHSELHAEVHKPVDLAAGIEVQLDNGVVPVEVDELLEEKRGGDL